MPPMVIWARDIITDSKFNSTMDPDMALSRSSGLGNTMALGASVDHTNLHGPRSNMALGHQHGYRWVA